MRTPAFILPVIISEDHFNSDFGDFRTEPPDPNLKPDYSERFHISGYNRIQQEEAYKFYQQWTAPGFPRVLIADINHFFAIGVLSGFLVQIKMVATLAKPREQFRENGG